MIDHLSRLFKDKDKSNKFFAAIKLLEEINIITVLYQQEERLMSNPSKDNAIHEAALKGAFQSGLREGIELIFRLSQIDFEAQKKVANGDGPIIDYGAEEDLLRRGFKIKDINKLIEAVSEDK